MDPVMFRAFVDEVSGLVKTSASVGDVLPSVGRLVSNHYLPVAGGFVGGLGGAALAGGEAYLHNQHAAPEDQRSVIGRALGGAALGAGIGAAGGHLADLGLDKGLSYTRRVLHDTGEAAAKGFLDPLKQEAPQIVQNMVDPIHASVPRLIRDTSREVGAAPVEAGRGFIRRLFGRG